MDRIKMMDVIFLVLRPWLTSRFKTAVCGHTVLRRVLVPVLKGLVIYFAF